MPIKPQFCCRCGQTLNAKLGFGFFASYCLVMVMKRHLGLLFLFTFIPDQIAMDSTSVPCQKAWASQLCQVFGFL